MFCDFSLLQNKDYKKVAFQLDKVGDFKLIVYVEFHCLRVGVGMAILSGMWELFADKARHLHPLYSTETLNIIGVVGAAQMLQLTWQK